MRAKILIKLYAAAVFIITLFVFFIFVCPTVYVGDSGELITACYGLGVAHPPGYPLFTLLGKLFTFLPLANIAFRVNLMAALFGSLTCSVLFIFMTEIFNKKYSIPAFFSSAMLALGPVFFSQTLQAKGGIYTLNAFLMILILLALQRYSREQKNGYLYLSGILIGLALANHHTSLFMFPVVLFLIRKSDKSGWIRKGLIFSAISAVFASLLYLYLPLRASANPLINWGNPYNLERTIYHVLRGQYGALSANAFSFDRLIGEAGVFFGIIIREFYAFIIAALLGIYYMLKNKNKLSLPVIFMSISGLLLLFVLNLEPDYKNIETFKVFCIISFIGIAILGFAGVVFLYEKNKLVAFGLGLVFLVPVAAAGINTAAADKTDLAYKFNADILRTLPKGSLLFCYGDNVMFPLVYLNKVEKIREDLFIYDDIGCVFKNIYGEDFVKLSDSGKNIVRKTVQFDLLRNFKGKAYFTLGSYLSNSGISSVPVGVLYLADGMLSGKSEMDKIWTSYGVFEKKERFEDYLLNDLAAQYSYFRGEYYLNLKDKEAAIQNLLLSAKRAGNLDYFTGNISRKLVESGFYAEAIDLASTYRNEYTLLSAGIASYKQKYIEAAEKYFEKALKIKPEFSEAYVNLGLVGSEKGDLAGAERNLIRGLELDTANTNALVGLAVVHIKMKQDKMAELELQKVLRFDPSNKLALKYLEILNKRK